MVASNNVDNTSLLFTEGTTPSSPAASHLRLFVRSSDHVLCTVNSSGTVVPYTSGGFSNPLTTTGDTIYSSSGTTAARLGIGSTGQVLTVAGGVPSWAAATGATFSGCKAYTTGVAISGAVVTFASEIYDTDTYHSTSSNTSRMTVPATGYYFVSASGFVSRTDCRIAFYVNGAIVRSGNVVGNSAGNYAFASGTFNLTATDYIEVFANTISSTTFGDNGSIGDNYAFTITRVG